MPIWKFKRKSKLLSLPISSRIMVSLELDTAYLILNEIMRETSYRVFNALEREIAHRILDVVDADSSYHILSSVDIDSAWHILYEILEREVGWKTLNALERTILWYFVDEALSGAFPIAICTAVPVRFEIGAIDVSDEYVATQNQYIVDAMTVDWFTNTADVVRFEYVALSQ